MCRRANESKMNTDLKYPILIQDVKSVTTRGRVKVRPLLGVARFTTFLP